MSESLYTRWFTWLLAGCVALAAREQIEAGEVSLDRYFPLQKGSYWIYSADVNWTEANSAGNIGHSHLTFKSEVIDTWSGENVFAARLRGFIHDLSWYEPNKPPNDHVIVRVGVNRYYIIDEDDGRFWEKITASKPDSMLEEIGDDNVLLDVPLRKGALYGEPAQTSRAWYCWAVTDERTASFPTLVSRRRRLQEFTIVFRTTPDYTRLDFTPGIGITGYGYAHHGTVANCHARLIRFHPG